MTFLGLFGSYFLSFAIGTGLATLTGFISAFWVVLGPEFKAYQRNWELTKGRDLINYDEDRRGGLYGAFYFGRVAHVAVVENSSCSPKEEYPLEEFSDYDPEQDEKESYTGIPWMIRLRVIDGRERTLQVHAKMSEEYLDLEEGMPVATVLLSSDNDFVGLTGLTDFFIPDVRVWIGDYPYLDKTNFVELLASENLLGLLDQERK